MEGRAPPAPAQSRTLLSCIVALYYDQLSPVTIQNIMPEGMGPVVHMAWQENVFWGLSALWSDSTHLAVLFH
jgi:hypothetical protein